MKINTPAGPRLSNSFDLQQQRSMCTHLVLFASVVVPERLGLWIPVDGVTVDWNTTEITNGHLVRTSAPPWRFETSMHTHLLPFMFQSLSVEENAMNVLPQAAARSSAVSLLAIQLIRTESDLYVSARFPISLDCPHKTSKHTHFFPSAPCIASQTFPASYLRVKPASSPSARDLAIKKKTRNVD